MPLRDFSIFPSLSDRLLIAKEEVRSPDSIPNIPLGSRFSLKMMVTPPPRPKESRTSPDLGNALYRSGNRVELLGKCSLQGTPSQHTRMFLAVGPRIAMLVAPSIPTFL